MTTIKIVPENNSGAFNEGNPIPDQVARRLESKRIYFSLLMDKPTEKALAESRRYLTKMLQVADKLESEIPNSISAVGPWIDEHAEQVRTQYRDYLDTRKSGMPRHYFSNKSHALYFLKSVAPTKMVDGAWLYGLTQHWNDARFSALIKIYLEELGEGVPEKNHVAIYKKLLAAHGCEQWHDLSDDHYMQGAIQLALGYHADRFLPEVIGFNVGYEQPPLHLRITAYELSELGIDPMYFTLHFTIDNASAGHARKSLEGLLGSLPCVGDTEVFFHRVIQGSKLNALGACTNSVIPSFDLNREFMTLLRKKSSYGRQAHSDYSFIGGRTVNEWLSDPAKIPTFVVELEKIGWIKRGQNPKNSHFWTLIEGNHAEMFGVFNAYEKQIIFDWISNGHQDNGSAQSAGTNANGAAPPERRLSQDPHHLRAPMGWGAGCEQNIAPAPDLNTHNALAAETEIKQNDFNTESRILAEKLTTLCSRVEVMKLLIPLMSPSRHYTIAGLMATRMFSKIVSD
jgi:hypothetical protein